METATEISESAELIEEEEENEPTFEEDLVRPIKTFVRRPGILVTNLLRFDVIEFLVFSVGIGCWGYTILSLIFENLNWPPSLGLKSGAFFAGLLLISLAYLGNFERREAIKKERADRFEKQREEKKKSKEAEQLAKEESDKRFQEIMKATFDPADYTNSNN